MSDTKVRHTLDPKQDAADCLRLLVRALDTGDLGTVALAHECARSVVAELDAEDDAARLDRIAEQYDDAAARLA